MDLRRWLLAGWFVVLAAVLASCSSRGDDAPTTTTDPVPVEQVLARAAAAMAEVDAVRFELESSGAVVALDGVGELGFESAEGHYVAPSSAEARLDVEALGLRTQVGIIAIDGEVWLTNPLSGRWERAPGGLSFDPAVLFDEQDGLPGLLRNGLEEPEVVSPANGDDGRHHVRARVPAERLAGLTGGLVEQGRGVELWIDGGTDLVAEVRVEVDAGTEAAELILTLDDYGEAVTIEAPEPGSGS